MRSARAYAEASASLLWSASCFAARAAEAISSIWRSRRSTSAAREAECAAEASAESAEGDEDVDEDASDFLKNDSDVARSALGPEAMPLHLDPLDSPLRLTACSRSCASIRFTVSAASALPFISATITSSTCGGVPSRTSMPWNARYDA